MALHENLSNINDSITPSDISAKIKRNFLSSKTKIRVTDFSGSTLNDDQNEMQCLHFTNTETVLHELCTHVSFEVGLDAEFLLSRHQVNNFRIPLCIQYSK